MTNDYKENILDYITGNLQQQTGQNDPQFQNVEETQNDLNTQIRAYFDSTVVYVDFVPSRNNKNEGLNYSVLACIGTLVGESSQSGAFVILDENYNIVQFISTYKDGTLIGVLSCLNVDDKGNFYAVEKRNNKYYIVELNNMVLKLEGQNNFEVVNKKTIQFPTTYTWNNVFKIYRDTSGQKYLILADRDFSGETKMVGISLQITDSNTWAYYNSNYELSNALSIFNNGVYVYWDNNGDIQFQIAVNDYGLIMLTKGTSNNMVATRITSDENYNNPYSNFIFKTNTLGYYSVIEDDDPNTQFKIYKIDLANHTKEVIYTDTSSYSINNQAWLYKNNNSIYFTQAKYNGSSFDLAFGLIDDKRVFTQDLGSFTASYFLQAFCYSNVINKFNKNYIYIQNQNTLFSLDFIWNNNNYNGNSFTSYASLVPHIGTIEDENEVEIFNRNLYNLSNYANRYTATLQVPNYFLNSDTLYNTLLYSKNNNLLCNSNIDTTKNIYEELYINFINQFNIIDNETSNENISGASGLVSSMLIQNENAYIGKYKINYKDNTNEIKTIDTNDLVISDLTTTYNIVVFVNKLIKNIDLISQDETITYQTINCSNLELNKYYKISQELRIE